MPLETFVSDMMRINNLARLWHWTTDRAQHHTTYEQFLTQNEQFTDSFVESILGNDLPLALDKVGVQNAFVKTYDLTGVREEISSYRQTIVQAQKNIEEFNQPASSELVSILDDVVELCSKTLYLLKLK